MAPIKISHSLVLLGILHLILLLFCLVTGAPSVRNHHPPSSVSPEDPTLIAPPHDAAQSSDSSPPRFESPYSPHSLEQKTKEEYAVLSPILNLEQTTFKKDEAKDVEVSYGILAEKSVFNNDDIGPSLSEAMTGELVEQTSVEQITVKVEDIHPSNVVESNSPADDNGEMAGAIPLPRTAPPLIDVIRARQKLGLELLEENIEQLIDNGQQSSQVNDLSETNSCPELSLSTETPITRPTLPSSSTPDKDDFKKDYRLPSKDHVKDSLQDDNIVIRDKPNKVDNVQFVAKAKEYLYESKDQASSGHNSKQSVPDEKVVLDSVKELPGKADDYVIGFESSSEITGDAKDALTTEQLNKFIGSAIEQQVEFIGSANAVSENSENKNLAEGEMTETNSVDKEDDSKGVTRNRVARVSRVLDNAALDRHAQQSPAPSQSPTAGLFHRPESPYNNGLLSNGSFSLHAALGERGGWAQSHFPAAEKKVEPPFADLKTKKQTSVGGFDHKPMQPAAVAGAGGHLGTLVGLFPKEGDIVNLVKDAAVEDDGVSSSGGSKDEDERDIDGRGSLEDLSSFEINDARLLANVKVGVVSVEDDVESLIGNHKVIAATPTLKPGEALQTDPLNSDDIKVEDTLDHVTHETKSTLEFSQDKIGPKEKHSQGDQTNGRKEGKPDEPAVETGCVTGENGVFKPVGNTVDITREDVTGTPVKVLVENGKDNNAEQPQLIKRTEAPVHGIVSRELHGVDPPRVDVGNKIEGPVDGGFRNSTPVLHETDGEQRQSKVEKSIFTEVSAKDLGTETIPADQLTNQTSSSAGVSDPPLDTSESELDQKGREATGKSSGEGDTPFVTDPSESAANSTEAGSSHKQEAAEDGTFPRTINGTKEQEDSIETYSQFAERVTMEKLNDGGGTSGGVVGGPGGAASPTKLGPSKKYNNKNYAGTDCGSKLLSANPEAQHASKVIQSNRDEYLLNDCKGKTWFVVELCESIRPSRFEIANFELFSNLPRDFSVLGSQRYPTRDWTLLGDYTGQEGSRGVQPFDIQTETFFKYIKVEINSHYGSEYYCPVSLFRVFGVSEFEVIDSLEDGADDLDDDSLEQQEEVAKGDKEDKKERSMLPTVLRSMLTNVLGVLNRGASLSISTHSNQTPPVDECTSLDPRYKIDENKCSLAPTINWHLGCYDAEYKYVLKLPIVEKTVENREFCKSLVDNLCSEKGNKEMREDEVKPGENSLSGSQVDLNFACSTRVCGNSYVCVMLCSHHLLALCHIKHYNLAVNPSPSSVNDSVPATTCPGNDSIIPKNLSTDSGIVSNDPLGQEPLPNYIIKNNGVQTEKDPEKEAMFLQETSAGDTENKDCGKQDDSVSESSSDHESPTSDSSEPKPLNPRSPSENNVESKDTDSQNGSSDNVKEKPYKKDKEFKDTGNESKPSKDKKVPDSKRNEPGTSTNGENVNGHRNGEPNGQNGSPLPTVEQDHQPPKESNGNAVLKESNGHSAVVTPPNKESVVVRLSNKIKVLEHNLSISSQYLEELSKRYKRQMEEMQQQFSSAVTALNRSTPSEEEEVVRRRLAEDSMDNLTQQMEELTKIVNRLAVDHENLATRVVEQHLLLMFAEVVLLFVTFYFCMRRQMNQPTEQQQPLQKSLPRLSPSQRHAVLGPPATLTASESTRRWRSPLALSWQDSTENGGSGGGRGSQKKGKEDWRNDGVTAGSSAEIRRGSIDSATGQKLKDIPKIKARRGSTENRRIAGSYRSLLIEGGVAAAPETVTRRRKKKGKVTVKRSNSSLPTCGYLSSSSKAPSPRATIILKEFSLQQQQSPQSWTAKLESRKRQPTSSCLERFGESTKCGSTNMNATSPTASDIKDKFQQPWSPVQSENSCHNPWHVSNSRSRSISGSSSATDGSVKSLTKSNNNRLNNSLARFSLSKQTKAKSRNASKESPKESDKEQKINQSSAGVLFSCERQNITKKNAKTKIESNPFVPIPLKSKESSLSPLPDNVVARRHHSLALVPYQDRQSGDFLSLNFKVNNISDGEFPSSNHDNSLSATPFSRRIGSVVASTNDSLAHVATSFFLNTDTIKRSESTGESINPSLHPLSDVSNKHLRKDIVCYSSPALSGHSGLMRISECSESSSALPMGADLELLSDTDSPAHTSAHQICDGVFWGPSDEKRPRRENSGLISPITQGVASGDSRVINKSCTRLKLHTFPLTLSRDVLSVSSDLSNVASSDSGFHQSVSEIAYPSPVGAFLTTSAPASWRCNGVAVTDDNHPLFSVDQFPELPSLPTQTNARMFSSLDRVETDIPITVARGGLVVVNGHATPSMNGHKNQDHSSQPSNVYDNSESRRKILHKRAGSEGSITCMKSTANKVNFGRSSLNGAQKETKGNFNRKYIKKSKKNTSTQRCSYGSVDKLSTTNGGIGPFAEGQSSFFNKSKTNTNGSPTSYRASLVGGRLNDGRASTNSSLMKAFTSTTASTASTSHSKEEGGNVGS